MIICFAQSSKKINLIKKNYTIESWINYCFTTTLFRLINRWSSWIMFLYTSTLESKKRSRRTTIKCDFFFIFSRFRFNRIYFFCSKSECFHIWTWRFNLLTIWKTWIKQHFTKFWPLFDGNFGNWLKNVIKQSKCNTYAEQHFKHSTYECIIFEVNMQEINKQLASDEMQLKNAWKRNWLIIIMFYYGVSFRCFWLYGNCNVTFWFFTFLFL